MKKKRLFLHPGHWLRETANNTSVIMNASQKQITWGRSL